MFAQAGDHRSMTRPQWAILIFLGVLASISLARGCVNAAASSADFQWSGTHLLLQHIDPWHQYLIGDPGHLLIRVQIPNYLPLLYILLIPLGVLPFSVAQFLWLGLNLLFTGAGTILCARFYSLDTFRTVVLTLLFLMSTPFRNSLGLGQQSLLILFLWAVALCRPRRPRTAWLLGLSYAKYSFAPPAFFYLLFEMGVLPALLSLIPVVVAFLAAYLWLGGSLLHPVAIFTVLVSPLKVASDGYFGAPGPNLMDLADFLLKRFHAPLWLDLAGGYLLPILLAGALIFRTSHQPARLHRPARVALLAILSVALLKHHNYDHVVLLFPAAYALRQWQQLAGRLVFALLCVSWFADRLLDRIFPPVPLSMVNFLLLAAMAILIYRNRAMTTDELPASHGVTT